jgi:hypothetical protein
MAVTHDNARSVAAEAERAVSRAVDGLVLERRRDRRFRRAPALRVRTERQALAFVDAVGFCSTFYGFPEGVPCLWEAVAGRARPRWPRRSHHDAAIGLTWELKDTLPAARRVYYGKLLKGRPLLVALDVFPAFYALIRGRQRARDYRAEYDAGRMTQTARRLMDALVRAHPQYTGDLRADTFMLGPHRTREFERAMAELQQGLWIVKTEERYEPTFSYRWDLLEAWLPGPVATGRRLARDRALEYLIGRYAGAAVFTRERLLQRLFGLPAGEIARAVRGLVARGGLTECEVAGWPGRWLVAPAEVRRLGGRSPEGSRGRMRSG